MTIWSTMKPLVNKKYSLKKFPGKGGWTFAAIPEIGQNKSKPFGWVKVRGTVDGEPLLKTHLMPMGNGKLFLPVKAEIRKKIGKGEGDRVHIILFEDNEPLKIPKEILVCLYDEPTALEFFNSLSESEKNFYVKWVESAKRYETKVSRMTKMIDRLTKRLKMYDKEK